MKCRNFSSQLPLELSIGDLNVSLLPKVSENRETNYFLDLECCFYEVILLVLFLL